MADGLHPQTIISKAEGARRLGLSLDKFRRRVDRDFADVHPVHLLTLQRASPKASTLPPVDERLYVANPPPKRKIRKKDARRTQETLTRLKRLRELGPERAPGRGNHRERFNQTRRERRAAAKAPREWDWIVPA